VIINGVSIDDTYAEAFGMKATRIVITADSLAWAKHSANAAFGFATSVIACGCEAGIERELSPEETPDGRPGVAGLLFAVSTKELAKQLERRVGQCVLTCPTTAVFAGCEGEEQLPLGKNLRYFGDGWQMSKLIGGRRYWRIPVMDGEFWPRNPPACCAPSAAVTSWFSPVPAPRHSPPARRRRRRSPECPARSRRSPAAWCVPVPRSAPNTRRCRRLPTMPSVRPYAAWPDRNWASTWKRCWRSSSTRSAMPTCAWP